MVVEIDEREIAMKKRIRPAILLTLVLIFLFPQSTGCAPKEIEQTNDSLKIAYWDTNSMVSYSLYEFKQQHPDVEVTTDFQPYTEDDPLGEAFFKRISAEVMSGSGPDLIILEQRGMNPNKMMRSGAFADLNEFIENDPDFDLSKYNGKVLEAGQVEGKQYIMPLTYTIPLVLTTQEMLDKTGFDISTAGNCNAFLEECLDVQGKNIEGVPELSMTWSLTPYLADAVDYDTREVKVNTPENRETIRLNYEVVDIHRGEEGWGPIAGGIDDALRVIENKAIFSVVTSQFVSYFYNYRTLKDMGTPVQAAVRDAEGRVMAQVGESAAINANSPNKQNAYEFIKLMLDGLSSEQQLSGMGNIPVSNEAVESFLKSLIGKEEKLSDVYPGYVCEVETLHGLTQEEADAYMGLLEEIDGAYLREKDVTEAHGEITRYYLGETTDLDSCIKAMEDKLTILISE